MRKSFRNEFLEFYDRYNAEKGEIASMIQISSDSVSDIKLSISKLVAQCAQMCRFHYLFSTNKFIPLEELLNLLREFQILSLSRAMRLFQRPNEKNNYLSIINQLTSNPTVFSQMIYFCFVSHEVLDEDSRKYFTFHTFPAIYNYFLSNKDQKLAVSFLTNLINLHFYLHGYDFSSHFRFISEFIFSYFLASNPYSFFDHSISPLLRQVTSSINENYFHEIFIGRMLITSLFHFYLG